MGKKFNQELSLYLHNQINAQPCHCFSNAVKALALLPKAEYTEGYIVSPFASEPLHHAWLELDGFIIDPSLTDGEREYFPVGHRTQAEYLQFVQEVEILKIKVLSPLPKGREDLPLHIQAARCNPDYDNILVGKMNLEAKSPEFDHTYKQALTYKRKLAVK